MISETVSQSLEASASNGSAPCSEVGTISLISHRRVTSLTPMPAGASSMRKPTPTDVGNRAMPGRKSRWTPKLSARRWKAIPCRRYTVR